MTTSTPRTLSPRANYHRDMRSLSYLLFFVASPAALTMARPTSNSTPTPSSTQTLPQMQMPSRQNILPSLRCSCISFSPASPASPCTLPGTQNLVWDDAERLARLHALSITFASPDTASKVLSAPVPLSTTQLTSLDSLADLAAREGERPAGTMMVCGAGDEVARAVLREERLSARVEVQEERVGGVLAVLVLGVILWALGECVWERFFSRIHLRGGERRLTVASRGSCAVDEREESLLYEKQGLDDVEFPDSPWGP